MEKNKLKLIKEIINMDTAEIELFELFIKNVKWTYCSKNGIYEIIKRIEFESDKLKNILLNIIEYHENKE